MGREKALKSNGGGLFTLPGHYIPSHAPNTSGLQINQIHNKQTNTKTAILLGIKIENTILQLS